MSLVVAVALLLPQQAEERSLWNREISQTFEADEIDVGVWVGRLERLGLELPIELDGKISGRLDVRVPWSSALDVKAWNATGTITSQSLQVSGVALSDLDVRLLLNDGILSLDRLSFRPGESTSVVRGSGRLPVDPVGDLTLRLNLKDFDLAAVRPVLRQAGLPEADTLSGRVTTTVEATVPPADIADPAAWTAAGPLTVRAFSYRIVPPADLDGTLRLRDGILQLPFTRLTAAGASATGEGTLKLSTPFAYSVAFDGTVQDDQLLQAMLGAGLPVGFSGRINAEGTLSGSLAPVDVSFRGTVEGQDLQARVLDRTFPVASVSATVALADAIVRVTELTAAIFEGTVTGNFLVDTSQEPGDSTATLSVQNIAAGDLASTFQLPTPVTGRLTADVDATLVGSKWDDLTAVRGTASLTSQSLTVGGEERAVAVRDLTLTARATEAQLAIERISAGVANGALRGNATLPWSFASAAPVGEASAAGQWEDLPLSVFSVVPGLPAVSGSTTGDVRFRVPADRLGSPLRWRAEGRASVNDLRVAGTPIGSLTADFDADDAEGTATFTADVFGGTAAGRVVRAEEDLKIQLQANGVRSSPAVDVLAALAPSVQIEQLKPVEGGVSADLSLSLGEGRPPVGTASVTSDSLSIGAGERAVAFSGLSLTAESTKDMLRLERLSAGVAGGTVAATASAPWSIVQTPRTGEATATAKWDGLPLRTLSLLPGAPPVSGTTAGDVQLRIPANRFDSPLRWRAEGEARITDLIVDETSVGSLSASFNLDDAQGTASFEGDVLGGTTEGTATRTADALDAAFQANEIQASPAVDLVALLIPTLPLEQVRPVRGALSADISLTLPAATSPDAGRPSGTATLTAPSLTIGPDERSLAIRNLTLTAKATEQGVALNRFSGQVAGGSVEATATAPWSFVETPRSGEATASADWRNLPLRSLSLIPGAPTISGTTAGDVRLRVPAERLRSPLRWRAEGRASVTELRIAETDVGSLSADFNADDAAGTASFSGDVFGGTTNGKAVRSADRTDARIRTERVELQRAVRVVKALLPTVPVDRLAPIGGTASADITASLPTGEPLRAKGGFQVSDLTAASVAIPSARGTFTWSGGRIWADVAADLFGGVATATVDASPETGRIVGRASVDGVALAGLPPALIGNLAAEGLLTASARFAASEGSEPLSERLRAEADARLTNARLSVGDRVVGAKSAEFAAVAAADRIWAKVSGQLLDGRAEVTASAPRDWRDGGTLSIAANAAGLGIAQAAGIVPVPDGWSGRLFADVTAAVPVSESRLLIEDAVARGPVRVAEVQYNGRLFSSRLEGLLDWSPSARRIESLSGTIATGQVSGTIALPAGGQAAPFQVGLSGVRTDKVGEFFGVDLPVRGRLDVSLRGSAGETVNATGTVTVAAGSIGRGRTSLRTNGVRVPLTLTYRPGADTLLVRVQGGRLSLSGGRVSGDSVVSISQISTDPRVGLEANLSLGGLNIGPVARELGIGTLGGRLTGTIDLSADRLREASDLSGSVLLNFRDASAGNSRIVTAVVPYLGRLTAFETGRIEARLSNGVANIRRLSASSPSLDLFAEGTVTVVGRRAGRLDLDVVAATGQPDEGALRSAIVQRAITVATPGVGLLLAASEAIRDRVLHLTVTGTASDPRVRVVPLETAREAGLRFLIQSAAGPAA